MPEGTANTEPVVDHLDEVWSSVVAACSQVAPEEWALMTACPGWTVKDQVSHLIGVEKMLLDEPAPPELPEVPDYVRNSFGAVNEAWVDARRDRPGEEVLAEFAETAARRLEVLRSMPADRFDIVGWSPVGQVPYREFMDTRVLDSWAHEQDIRQALTRPGGRNGAGEATVLARCERTMPYVVGKRVAASDGTSVRFRVEGPLGVDFGVVVEHARAASVALPAEVVPSVTVEMDQDVFWRLCFGRVEPGSVISSGRVAITGDEDLGRRVIGSMSFMM
ncbi:MAG: maleylpyruvate isomerase family mycothiol-dependent enzyme [Acidimicrobiales bacterium]